MSRSLGGTSNVSVNGRIYRMVKRASAPVVDAPPAAAPGKRVAESSGEVASDFAGNDEPACEVLPSKTSAVEVRMKLLPAARRAVIGHGGRNIRELKANSGASIFVPKARDEDVVITGTPEAVEKARTMVQQISDRTVSRLQPTHFLSLPISDACVQQKVASFVRDICGGRQDIPESICVQPSRLHVTLGMLNLHTPELVMQAVRTLEAAEREIVEEVLGGKPVSIDLAGIKVMEADTTKAHVMYIVPTEADGSGRLIRLCQFLIKRYTDKGLMNSEKRPLKLHVTILNTKYGARKAHKRRQLEGVTGKLSAFSSDKETVAPPAGSSGTADANAMWPRHAMPRHATQTPFSAREILECHGASAAFGRCRMSSVAVACRHEFVPETGTYRYEGSLQLP